MEENIITVIALLPRAVWWPSLLPRREVEGLQAGHGVGGSVEVDTVPVVAETVLTGILAICSIKVLT